MGQQALLLVLESVDQLSFPYGLCLTNDTFIRGRTSSPSVVTFPVMLEDPSVGYWRELFGLWISACENKRVNPLLCNDVSQCFCLL